MSKLLLVFLGGGLGACSRWLLATALNTAGLSPQGFPWGTLGVNLLGCFLIGLLAGLFERTNATAEWGLFFITGILGGFTTFSSFGLETFRLVRGNQLALAVAYVSASNIFGVSLVAGGYTLSRVISL